MIACSFLHFIGNAWEAKSTPRRMRTPIFIKAVNVQIKILPESKRCSKIKKAEKIYKGGEKDV